MRVLLLVTLLLLVLQPAWGQSYTYDLHYATAGNYVSFRNYSPLWTDGYNGEILWPSDWPMATHVNFALYNVNGVNGWNGATGFYMDDNRSPLAAGQTRVIDNIYLWAGPNVQSQKIGIVRELGSISPDVDMRLTLLYVPQGIDYSGPWQWNKTYLLNAAVVLPFYSTSDGTTGYRFRLEFTAVPEPSSLLALAGGVTGIGGLALRRRRV